MIVNNKNKKTIEKELTFEFIKRRIHQVNEQEQKKTKEPEKNFIEKQLIKKGYWPEEDSHHDNIRAYFIQKCLIVGIYISSIWMLLKTYNVFLEFFHRRYMIGNWNQAYHVHFNSTLEIHYSVAFYILYAPLLLILLYKLFWIHIPRMRRASWYRRVHDKELSPRVTKINKYLNYYMIFAIITLNSYAKMLTIYNTTEDLYDLIYTHNNDYQPLFYSWEIYLLKTLGLWIDYEVTFSAKYFSCVTMILDQLYVPEPRLSWYNPRTGTEVTSRLAMRVINNFYKPPVLFLTECTEEEPGNVDVLFKTLRTLGPEEAVKQFKILYQEEIDGYNKTMIEIQKGLCKAYNEEHPLRLGRRPLTPVSLYQPFPRRWIKEMAEGNMAF